MILDVSLYTYKYYKCNNNIKFTYGNYILIINYKK